MAKRNGREHLRTAGGLAVAVGFALSARASGSIAAPYSLQRTYLGENPLDQFGFAVAAAGDVNHDGFDDFLVGANVNDDAAPAGGKVYLYLGGFDAPAAAALTFAGPIELGYVGGAVCGGGDLNGDGFDDWVAGAPGLGAAGTDSGRVYVFLGGAAPDSVPDLVLEGNAAGGQFGAAVAIVPDLDGDGFGDLVVGAPREGNGAVYLYRGGSPLDPTPDRVLHARVQDQRFGRSLAVLPDEDGDGRDDLLVGAPRSSEAAVWAGAVILYRGTAALDSVPDLVFLGRAAGDEFGSSIAAGSDTDGDGQGDLLIGAPAANPAGAVDAGEAYLFRGGTALDSTADLTVSGLAAGDRFGTSVALGFDWDGDGERDFAVGAPNRNAGGAASGAVHVFRGGAALDATEDFEEAGPVAGAHLGKSLGFVGDVRANGRGNVLAGGYNQADAGRALLFGVDEFPAGAGSSGAMRADAVLMIAPNPFRHTTRIAWSIPLDPSGGTIRIYDVSGRAVRTFALRGGTGRGGIVWDGRTARGRRVAEGVYFVRLESGDRAVTRKVIRRGP